VRRAREALGTLATRIEVRGLPAAAYLQLRQRAETA
jgi:hypothetical protein